MSAVIRTIEIIATRFTGRHGLMPATFRVLLLAAIADASNEDLREIARRLLRVAN